MFINNQGNYLNKSDTEVELDILLIASPTKFEIVNTSIFFIFLLLLCYRWYQLLLNF